jgi:hypothetical protein
MDTLWVFREEDGSMHTLRFIIDDSKAVFGVLVIPFAELDPE